jgi:K319-like protein
MRGFEQITKGSRVALILLLLLALGLCASAQTQGQAPIPWPQPAAIPPAPPIVPDRGGIPTGFDITGFIQYASLDPTPGLCNKDDNPVPTPLTPPLPDQCKITGGWIELNNTLIRVPQSTVVIFPNTLLTWEEAFELNPNTHQTDPVFQTGLAMADTVRFPGTYQGHVQGNIVNGQYIAGIVFIFQDPANQTQGFIERFDYAHGIIWVNGTRIQVNDPPITFTVPNPDGTPMLDNIGNPIILTKGRYSAGQSADPRFAVDQNNPTVNAQNGYPMCVPQWSPYADGSDGSEGPALNLLLPDDQQDQQCPEKNRARDLTGTSLQMVYTMNAPGAPPTIDNPVPQNPYVEVPMEVGDFVSVIGTLEYDDQGPFITATDIEDTSVGPYTWPNTDPAYVHIDVVIQGTGGVPAPFFPQEAGVRTRVEGFMTDPQRSIDVSAIDQDCNGNLTFREPAWTANFPTEPGPPGVGVKGRWRMRFPQGGDFMPPVQNVGARISGSAPGKNQNGLTYSEYQLPSGEFIFPENQVPGSPPPSANFSDITFLVNGMGNLPMVSDVFDSTQVQLGQQPIPFYPNQVMGQLNPFPDATLPPLTCFPGMSTTVARATYISTPDPPFAGLTVTLDGSASTPNSGPFLWAQVLNPGDPQVVINNPTAQKPTFTAPFVGGPQNLTFSLQVGDGNAVPIASTTLVVPVVPPSTSTAPVVQATATGPDPFSPPPPALPQTVSGTSITVNSGVQVTLNATGVDPAGGTLTFNWTAPGGITLSSTTGATVTFTTPNVPELTANQVLTFQVTGTSSVSGLVSAPVTVTVSVMPVVDKIVISNIVYRRAKGRLVVNVSDFTPGVVLTCTLDILDAGTGLPYQGVMGPIIPFAQGVFSITFSAIPPPNLVTITSSAGGTATGGITFLR